MSPNLRETASGPLVSIIIPCYNAESFIGEAIESALAQTYPNVEVIVIDDGSTDGSLGVIRTFGDRIRWESGPNRGGCAARNRGIELAAGEWVQFLDADDLLYPDKLARQVPVAMDHQDSITYTDHLCRCLAAADAPQLRARPVTDEDPFVFVLQHRTLHTSGPLYRRHWLTEIGGFLPGLRASQEFEMNLRLAAQRARDGGVFLHLPEPLFEVRRREDSVSSNTARTFAVKVDYLPAIVSDLKQRDELSPHRRRELAAYAAGIGRQCIRGGEVRAGLALIDLANELDAAWANARAWGPAARWFKALAGPVALERLVAFRRRVKNSLHGSKRA